MTLYSSYHLSFPMMCSGVDIGNGDSVLNQCMLHDSNTRLSRKNLQLFIKKFGKPEQKNRTGFNLNSTFFELITIIFC